MIEDLDKVVAGATNSQGAQIAQKLLPSNKSQIPFLSFLVHAVGRILRGLQWLEKVGSMEIERGLGVGSIDSLVGKRRRRNG